MCGVYNNNNILTIFWYLTVRKRRREDGEDGEQLATLVIGKFNCHLTPVITLHGLHSMLQAATLTVIKLLQNITISEKREEKLQRSPSTL